MSIGETAYDHPKYYVGEVAPPGWGHTKAEKEKTKPNKPKSEVGGSSAAFKRALDDGRFKGLPGDKTKKDKVASMFKIMWANKKKGYKPHYKPGTDEKYKKYQEESSKCNGTDKGVDCPVHGSKKCRHKINEKLSTKDAKKLNKASALSQSEDPKDWESARARQTEIDYKDLIRQRKSGKVGVGASMKTEGMKSFQKYQEQSRKARERLAAEIEKRKKDDAAFVERKTKGIKFFDKKGEGRIVKGKKVYGAK